MGNSASLGILVERFFGHLAFVFNRESRLLCPSLQDNRWSSALQFPVKLETFACQPEFRRLYFCGNDHPWTFAVQYCMRVDRSSLGKPIKDGPVIFHN